MAFELIMVKVGRADALPDGTCAVHKSGRVRFVYRDLMKVGIKDECFILIDRDKKLIAMRKPNPEEAAATFRLGGKGACREVSMGQAFKLIGLDASKCAGRLPVNQNRDGLLYIVPEVTVGLPGKKK